MVFFPDQALRFSDPEGGSRSLARGFAAGNQARQTELQRLQAAAEGDLKREALNLKKRSAARTEGQENVQVLGRILSGVANAPDDLLPQVLEVGKKTASALGIDTTKYDNLTNPAEIRNQANIDLQILQNLQKDVLSSEAFEQQKVLRKAGSPQTTVLNDLRAQNEFAKIFGRKNAETFFERREGAIKAQTSLKSNKEALALLDRGVTTGFGADFRVGFGKALQLAGFSESEDEIANTEAFAASRAREVGTIIELFGAGTGLSDADREFATKAAAGDISMTEKSMRRILEINERASRNIIKLFNKDAEQIPSTLSPFPLTIDTEEPAEKNLGEMSDEEIKELLR